MRFDGNDAVAVDAGLYVIKGRGQRVDREGFRKRDREISEFIVQINLLAEIIYRNVAYAEADKAGNAAIPPGLVPSLISLPEANGK